MSSGSKVKSSNQFIASWSAFFKDIKIQHSVFALPFAMVAFVIGSIPAPSPTQVLLLLVSMICARSFAMGMNRYLDHKIDAANPRTATRMIPAGTLAPQEGLGISLLFGAVFIAASFGFNVTTGLLSLPLLMILAGYSLLKRVTWLCHFYLGLCLGLSPIAVSVALTGQVAPALFFVCLAMTFWTAGFDVLYATQDMEFDRENNLKSLPVLLGKRGTLKLSVICFVFTILSMIVAGVLFGGGVFYYFGVLLVAFLLTYEHYIARPQILKPGPVKNINKAFFNMNAYVSVVFCAFSFFDLFWKTL